jgi:trypsin
VFLAAVAITTAAQAIHSAAAAKTASLERHGNGGPSPAARLPNSRIVGGTPTSIAQMPWQVALAVAPEYMSGDGYDRQFCGGSLIAPTLVVTAAHCTIDGGSFIGADEMTVISGRTQLSSSSGRESHLVDYYTFVDDGGHELYDPQTGAWDVALLELDEPALGTPIKLPGDDEVGLWSRGRAAYVSGWGAVREDGTFPDGLLSTELAVYADLACDRTYEREWDPRTSMCAGTQLGNHDSCQGDSGGPFVARSATGEYRLIGNVQGGFGCGRQFVPGVYGSLGEAPMRGAIRAAALDIAGYDVVGTGLRAPTTVTRQQAVENAWMYVEDDCYRWRKCRQYQAMRTCRRLGSGYRCKVKEFAKSRRGRFRCSQRVLVDAASGSITRRGIGKWKCRWGW